MLQMSSLSAINLPVIDMAVYMINCIYSIHSMLSLYEYTDKKLEKLEAQVSLFRKNEKTKVNLKFLFKF